MEKLINIDIFQLFEPSLIGLPIDADRDPITVKLSKKKIVKIWEIMQHLD